MPACRCARTNPNPNPNPNPTLSLTLTSNPRGPRTSTDGPAVRTRQRADELQTEEIFVGLLDSGWSEGTLSQVERLLRTRFDRHQSELIKVLLRLGLASG